VEYFANFPNIHEKLIQEIQNLTLSPPPLPMVIQGNLHRALSKRLFETGFLSDFEILFGSKSLKVHSCILGMNWKYFEIILSKDNDHYSKMPIETFQKMTSKTKTSVNALSQHYQLFLTHIIFLHFLSVYMILNKTLLSV